MAERTRLLRTMRKNYEKNRQVEDERKMDMPERVQMPKVHR